MEPLKVSRIKFLNLYVNSWLSVLKHNVNDGYQVKLMSMDGRLIYGNIFTKAKVLIKNIPPSTYLLEVVFNDGSKAVKKVIIN